MKGWRDIKLKDVSEYVTVGFVGSMADQYVDSGVPFLRSLNIQPFQLNYKDLKYISESFHDSIKKSKLCPGDVAIVRTGYPGTACVIPADLPNANCSDLVILRPGPELNPHYVAAVFNSSFGQSLVGGNLVGAAQQHFNVTVAKELKLLLPPRAEQDKIAAVLVGLNDLIANNQRRIALLESMAEEIYREWFVRMRFPGYEKVKTERGIPVGWSPSNLGSIANFVMGQSPSSEYYNEIGDGLPFHQGVGTYGDRYPVHKIFCSSEGRRAKSGDILFSVRAPVGRLNIADTDLIIGRGLATMRHKQGFNSFLFYLLKATFANEDMIGNGSIFNSVGKDELARYPILSPPTPLVQEFQNTVVPIDSQLATLYASTSYMITMRDALLPRLISGKLRVDQLGIQYPPSMMAELAQAAQG